MKIKIMHIAQSNGGVSRYLKMMFKYMDKNKYEQILVCSEDYLKEKNIYEELVDSVEVIKMKREICVKDDILAIKKINQLIKKYNPDIIYAHSSKAGALARITNVFRKKFIIYNPHGWAFNMGVSNAKKRMYIYIERILSLFCDKIIAISEWEKKVALKYSICDEKKIILIPNGIDVEEYEKRIKNDIQLNIPNNSIVIGMVGRISKQKSPEVFIKSAYEIKKVIKNSFFIIVGDGEDRESIEKEIENLGMKECFFITGWVSNVYDYIDRFDIAMLLSKWEGFGLALVEYMLAGKPVIANNVDAIPEIVEDKKTGIIINKNDIREIVEAVVRIVDDQEFRKFLIKNSKNKVYERYDVRRVVKDHSDLYESSWREK